MPEAPALSRTTDEKIEIWRYWANEEWLWAWACEHGTHMYGYSSHQVLLTDLGNHFAAYFDKPLLCVNCGKTMSEHDEMAHCWGPESKTFTAHNDGSECGTVDRPGPAQGAENVAMSGNPVLTRPDERCAECGHLWSDHHADDVADELACYIACRECDGVERTDDE